MLKTEHLETLLGVKPPSIPMDIKRSLNKVDSDSFSVMDDEHSPGYIARLVRQYVIDHGPCTAREVYENIGFSLSSCERFCGIALKAGDFYIAEKKVTRYLRARLYKAKPGLKA